MSGSPPLPIVQDVFVETENYVLQEYFPEPQQPDSTTTFMCGDQIIISWMTFDTVLL